MRGEPIVADSDQTPGRFILVIAREAVERYVRDRTVLVPPAALRPPLGEPGAAFVTIRANRRLRGCVGTVVPTEPDLAREIVRWAVVAASRDPRFVPVIADELSALSYEVHLIHGLEPVPGPEALDPAAYGVVVASDHRRAVLLPRLAGIDTVERQLAVAREKAGIADGQPLTLYRFRARRVAEDSPGHAGAWL
jgi:AmmeMemoRadiSam system protein A